MGLEKYLNVYTICKIIKKCTAEETCPGFIFWINILLSKRELVCKYS
jgi:hypothetical protein